MKVIKGIVIVLLALFILITVVGFFLPSEVSVRKSIQVNAEPQAAYVQVVDLHVLEEWSPWAAMDSNTKYTYSDSAKGVGAWYAWESNNTNVGSGKLTILEANPYESIKTEVDFGDQGIANGFWTFIPNEEGSEVTWGFTTDLGSNPYTKYFGLFMESMMEEAFTTGLSNVKKLAEAYKPKAKIEVSQENLEKMWFVTQRVQTTHDMIGPKIGEIFGVLGAFIGEQGIEMASPPINFAHEYTETEIDMEPGLGIPDSIGVPEGINLVAVEGPHYMTQYFGDYNDMEQIWTDFMQWVHSQGTEINGAPFEMYITDPMEEPDTSKWETRIYCPVASF